MDKDKLKVIAKQHGATAAVGVVALAALLTRGGNTTVVAPPEPPKLASHASSLSEGQLAHNGQELRLVSCGDSRKARVTGGDEAGQLVLGVGARGKCTVLFARPWTKPPHCEVKGGHVATLTTTDLAIDHVDGPVLAYSCQP